MPCAPQPSLQHQITKFILVYAWLWIETFAARQQICPDMFFIMHRAAAALNPARDLGPRLAHWLLPIPGKGKSEWRYSWVPITAGAARWMLRCCCRVSLTNGVQWGDGLGSCSEVRHAFVLVVEFVCY